MVAKEGNGIGIASRGTVIVCDAEVVFVSPLEGTGRGRLLLALTAANAEAASV